MCMLLPLCLLDLVVGRMIRLTRPHCYDVDGWIGLDDVQCEYLSIIIII